VSLYHCSSDPLAGFRGEDRIGKKKEEEGKGNRRGTGGKKKGWRRGIKGLCSYEKIKALQFLNFFRV